VWRTYTLRPPRPRVEGSICTNLLECLNDVTLSIQDKMSDYRNLTLIFVKPLMFFHMTSCLQSCMLMVFVVYCLQWIKTRHLEEPVALEVTICYLPLIGCSVVYINDLFSLLTHYTIIVRVVCR